MPFTLHDLHAFSPTLAKSLTELLEFEGNVEEVFCRDYVASYEHFGAEVVVGLVEGGENIPVTKENREKFVEDYIDW